MSDSILQNSSLRIGIVSDTHAFLDPRISAVLNTCDISVHAGDICGAQILAEMESLTETVIAVAGNNDFATNWPEHESHIVQKLPMIAEIKLSDGQIVIEHGDKHGFQTPDHNSLRRTYPFARAIIYGHTHKQIFDDAAKPWIINPGAAGKTRTHGGPSCALIVVNRDHWKVELKRFAPLKD